MADNPAVFVFVHVLPEVINRARVVLRKKVQRHLSQFAVFIVAVLHHQCLNGLAADLECFV